MYQFRFVSQSRHGSPDSEGDSIMLTREQYDALPTVNLTDVPRPYHLEHKYFSEQTRAPSKTFPALLFEVEEWRRPKTDPSITNPSLALENELLYPEVYFVAVCLHEEDDIWVAFKFCDNTTLGEAYDSTVGVSYPCHGDVYRLSDSFKEYAKSFF